MKNQDVLTLLLLFLASMTSTVYSIISDTGKEALNRMIIGSKLLGSAIVAFFIMPAIMEHFNLTLRMTLMITVVFAYGFEAILKASVNKVIKTIDLAKQHKLDKEEENERDNIN